MNENSASSWAMVFNKLAEISKKVNGSRVLMTLHPDPDLDSLCSNYAMKKIIEKTFSKTIVNLIGGDSYRQDYFHKSLEFMTQEIIPKTYKQYVDEGETFDLFLVLDISRPKRISQDLSLEEFEKLNVIVIDHHASNSFVNSEKCLVLLDKNTSSTCEMISDSKKLFPLGTNFWKLLSIPLYLGIFSDTKGFTFGTSSKTLSIVSQLKDDNEELIDSLINQITRNWSFNDLVQFSFIFPEIVRLRNIENIKNKKVWIFIYDKDLNIFKLLNFLSKVEGIDILVVCKKESDRYWIEIQSWLPKEDEVAKKLALAFDGGGHPNRAGGVGDFELSSRYLQAKILKNLEEIL